MSNKHQPTVIYSDAYGQELHLAFETDDVSDKRRRFFVLLVICMFSLLSLAACGTGGAYSDQQEEMVANSLWEELITDNSENLEDLLSTEYELNDLEAYFGQIKGDSPIVLSIEDVNNRFPIEVLRPNGYSVYRVSQGGYYYVFWSGNNPLKGQFEARLNDGQIYTITPSPIVYFTAFLCSGMDKNAFSSLESGKSTIEDTYLIDPNAELVDYLSHAIYSYSYLNERELLRITYVVSEKENGSYDLVYVNSTIVPRVFGKNESRFSSLLTKDLP